MECALPRKFFDYCEVRITGERPSQTQQTHGRRRFTVEGGGKRFTVDEDILVLTLAGTELLP